jgi:hypothetical protein
MVSVFAKAGLSEQRAASTWRGDQSVNVMSGGSACHRLEHCPPAGGLPLLPHVCTSKQNSDMQCCADRWGLA